MKKLVITIVLLLIMIPFNMLPQSGREINLKVTDFVKGLPTDLETNVIVLNKLDFIAENFDYDTDKSKIEKHWQKCLKALELYPFKYIVVEDNEKRQDVNDAKYQIRFYPEFTGYTLMGNTIDRILTLKEKNSTKHYGLKEQSKYGNSKAKYSFYEIKYFVNEVKKAYKIE